MLNRNLKEKPSGPPDLHHIGIYNDFDLWMDTLHGKYNPSRQPYGASVDDFTFRFKRFFSLIYWAFKYRNTEYFYAAWRI